MFKIIKITEHLFTILINIPNLNTLPKHSLFFHSSQGQGQGSKVNLQTKTIIFLFKCSVKLKKMFNRDQLKLVKSTSLCYYKMQKMVSNSQSCPIFLKIKIGIMVTLSKSYSIRLSSSNSAISSYSSLFLKPGCL